MPYASIEAEAPYESLDEGMVYVTVPKVRPKSLRATAQEYMMCTAVVTMTRINQTCVFGPGVLQERAEAAAAISCCQHA